MKVEHPNLVGGATAVAAVTTLLELLRRTVTRRVDAEVTELWVSGRQLSQQIVAGHLLKDTVVESRKLVEELEKHVQTLKETTR